MNTRLMSDTKALANQEESIYKAAIGFMESNKVWRVGS